MQDVVMVYLLFKLKRSTDALRGLNKFGHINESSIIYNQ